MKLPILSFRAPETFARVQTTADNILNGFSTAYLEPFRAKTGGQLAAHFHGNLNPSLPPDAAKSKVLSSGWAMFKTKNRNRDPNAQFRPFYLFKSQANFWWDWSPFEVMHLRIKNLTPDRKFMVNVQTDTMSRTDLYQHRLFTDNSGQWQDVFVNLGDFVLTNRRHRASSTPV